MNKRARKRLSVWLSLFLTVFLFCQGMAKAAVSIPIPIPSQPAVADALMSCHQMGMADPSAHPAHGDMGCQHLDKAFNAEYQASLWNHVPLVALFYLPLPADDAGSPIPVAALPWHDPPGDPPIPIRFQRFLK